MHILTWYVPIPQGPDARTGSFWSAQVAKGVIIKCQSPDNTRTGYMATPYSVYAGTIGRAPLSIYFGHWYRGSRYINSMSVYIHGSIQEFHIIILSVMKQETDESRLVRLFDVLRGARACKRTLFDRLGWAAREARFRAQLCGSNAGGWAPANTAAG